MLIFPFEWKWKKKGKKMSQKDHNKIMESIILNLEDEVESPKEKINDQINSKSEEFLESRYTIGDLLNMRRHQCELDERAYRIRANEKNRRVYEWHQKETAKSGVGLVKDIPSKRIRDHIRNVEGYQEETISNEDLRQFGINMTTPIR